MNPTPLLLALLTLSGALTATIPDASAQGRVRGRAVAHAADGGRMAATRTAARGERGAFVRGRDVRSDGQGHAAGRSGAYAVGANGGTAQRHGSFYRNADGSAGRQGSASIDGAHGGSLHTSGGIVRDASGNLDGNRSTSLTGRNGNSYNGSTTVQDGVVTRTRACSDAAGQSIACRSR